MGTRSGGKEKAGRVSGGERKRRKLVEKALETTVRSVWSCPECDGKGKVLGELMDIFPPNSNLQPGKLNQKFVYRHAGKTEEEAHVQSSPNFIDFDLPPNHQQSLAEAFSDPPPPTTLPFRLSEQPYKDKFGHSIPQKDRFKNQLSNKVLDARLSQYKRDQEKWLREARLHTDLSELVDLDGESVGFWIHLPPALSSDMKRFKGRYMDSMGAMRKYDARHLWQVRDSTLLHLGWHRNGSS
ncbi:hypothetical protein BDY24DRAFT_397834 [Mrakia frigida]|uniref:uncharacterized protein n=1 Tax=Mrakia frigida TaxID=29902 RepID=UPI003FCBF11C